MMISSRHSVRPTLLTAAIALAASSVAVAHDAAPKMTLAGPELAAEATYLAENDAAMAKMAAGMAVMPSGDVDRDFVALMVPHHQGAIDMAVALVRHGRNEQLKRLAQEIIVTQQQEIAAMRLAVGEQLPPSVPSPTQPSLGPAAPAGPTTK